MYQNTNYFLALKNTIVLGSTLQKGLPCLVHEIYFGYQSIILSAEIYFGYQFIILSAGDKIWLQYIQSEKNVFKK